MSSYSRVEYHVDDSKEEVQRSLRYYASNEGGELFKVKWIEEKDNGKEIVPAHWSYQTLLSGSKVTLFNDYYDSEDYDINYQYYIDECNKIICLIEGKKWIDKSKILEKLDKLYIRRNKLLEKENNFIEKNKTHLKAYEVNHETLVKVLAEIDELNLVLV